MSRSSRSLPVPGHLRQGIALFACGIVFCLMLCVPSGVQGQTPLTYDRILELLKLEIKEEKLFQLLKEQPTVFTLSDAEIAKLKAAGASDKLLAMMRAKSTEVIESDTSAYVMILDASGSMLEKAADGKTKWEVAKRSASDLISAVPDGLAFSVVVYGHDNQKACGVDVLRPLATLSESDKAALIQRIERIEPVGKTPITKSLNLAAEQLQSSRGLAKILLITDGLETCGGNPTDAAKKFAESAESGRSIDVIGFALAGDENAAVSQIATQGKGKYFEAKSSQELAIAFDQAAKELRKLTKTDGAVKLKASKDLAEPTAIEIGTYTKARLALKNSHFWTVRFPAGKYVVVFDAESADRRGNVLGQAELGVVENGNFTAEANALISHNEVRGRGVMRVDLREPATRLIKVTSIFTDVMDYHLGVFRADSQFGIPFLVNCPEITALELGKAATSPAIASAGEFNLDRDAFFEMTIPEGDSNLEVTWTGGAKDEFAALRSVDLRDQYGVFTKTLLSSTPDKSAKIRLQAADEQKVILRVRGAAKGERITVKLTSIENE